MDGDEELEAEGEDAHLAELGNMIFLPG